jgi:hypothetical protein
MAAVFPRRPEGGTQAERIMVPAVSVVPIGDDIDLVAAAAMPMNGLTALEGLHALGLEPSATLAVTGGAGLLASYAIPLAKRARLRVIADAKPSNTDLVASFGADVVVPQRRVRRRRPQSSPCRCRQRARHRLDHHDRQAGLIIMTGKTLNVERRRPSSEQLAARITGAARLRLPPVRPLRGCRQPPHQPRPDQATVDPAIWLRHQPAHSNISLANEAPGSQTGSQRPQDPGRRQATPSRCGNSQTARQATPGIVGPYFENAS